MPAKPSDNSTKRPSGVLVAPVLMMLATLVGCAAPYQRDDTSLQLVRAGEFGRARERVVVAGIAPDDRSFILNRMKLLTLSVDDGVADATEVNADQVYDLLRTQGLNDDKTVSTFLLGEAGTRVYKGEPYEQALAYSYIAMLDALQGEWGNARASAADSLFLLREFGSAGPSPGRQQPTPAQAQGQELPASLAYEPIASDFELGLILKGVAAAALGEREEATDAAARLAQVAPRLADFARAIPQGNYNTVLIAAYGTAPRKLGTGPDKVIASYVPTTSSDDAMLSLRVGQDFSRVPIATDINRLARDVRWRNLEDMRRAKSALGDALVTGGVVVAASAEDNEAKLAGAGAALVGLLMKATAGVDERHNELFPQRFYVALLTLPQTPTPIELQVEGKPSSRVVLTGMRPANPALDPSQANLPQLAFVRLPMTDTSWATSGRVLYSNDAQPRAAGDTLPFILGGRCVRTPTPDAMESYYRAGLPRSVTLNELIDLYREEGIQVLGDSVVGAAGRHILEGGSWLFTPTPGSAGFVRLYAIERSPWPLRSALGQDILGRISQGPPATAQQAAPSPPSAPQPARRSWWE